MRERVERRERNPEGEDDEMALVAHADARARERAVVVALQHARTTHGAVVCARRPIGATRPARVPRPVGADVTSTAVTADPVAVFSRLVCRHLDNVHRPTRQPVRLPSAADVGDGH